MLFFPPISLSHIEQNMVLFVSPTLSTQNTQFILTSEKGVCLAPHCTLHICLCLYFCLSFCFSRATLAHVSLCCWWCVCMWACLKVIFIISYDLIIDYFVVDSYWSGSSCYFFLYYFFFAQTAVTTTTTKAITNKCYNSNVTLKQQIIVPGQQQPQVVNNNIFTLDILKLYKVCRCLLIRIGDDDNAIDTAMHACMPAFTDIPLDSLATPRHTSTYLWC